MRNMIVGACMAAGVGIAFWGGMPQRDRLWAAPSQAVGPTGVELITWATPAGDQRQIVTVVIDPRTRTMCVYHVETTTGFITLKSVRNLHFDLQMVEFNGQDPTPKQIRSMLEQR